MAVLQNVKWVNRLSELPMRLTAFQEERVSHPGSLTHFLQSTEFPGVTFELLDIDQVDQLLEDHDMLSALGEISVFRRAVLWSHQAEPWVYAESWIPETLIQAHPEVMESEAPIGQWLFNGQPVQRSAFKFAMLSPADAFMQRAASKLACQVSTSLIARRRQYTMADQYSLMVIEVFFESCMQRFS